MINISILNFISYMKEIGMSSPDNMRTGISLGSTPENFFPETFFIIYLILASILRRCGFKDGVLYAQHSKVALSNDIFESGVLFNLLSPYGVGKSLESLLLELFTTISIDPDLNRNNVFFQEIIRLTPDVSRVIRSHNAQIETEWMFNYAIQMEYSQDDIAKEREFRLEDLLNASEEYNINNKYNCFRTVNVNSENYRISDSTETNDNNSNNNSNSQEYNSNTTSTENINSNSQEYNINMEEEIESKTNSDMETSDDEYSSFDDEDECDCDFCEEFSKFHHPHSDRNVTEIINNTLIEISKQINRR